MGTTLDGQFFFDEQTEFEQGSFAHTSIERTVPGLEGVLSIDLGGRGRKIRQTGVLRANSIAQMNERISKISAFMDGNIHTLVSSSREFDNLRMDSFKINNERAYGNGVAVDYEIVYMQLKV